MKPERTHPPVVPSAAALVLLALSAPSEAVIVGGSLGTGNNNDDPAVLQSWLSSNSYTSFGYWDNLVRVGDASGIYLGYNAATQTGWILSAAHISPDPSAISVAGSTYTVAATHSVGSTDLILYEIGGTLGDPALPALPTVPLASSTAVTGEFALMTGRGYTTSSTYPYPWGPPGATDAIPMRWGTNTVEFNATVSGNEYIVTDFDSPIAPGVTAYEAQASVGDSGGGLFIYRDGQWILSGIAHFVDDGPTFLLTEPVDVDPSEYGDYTAYTSVSSYLSTIQSITGTLIPEPSAPLLLSLASLGLLLKRRR